MVNETEQTQQYFPRISGRGWVVGERVSREEVPKSFLEHVLSLEAKGIKVYVSRDHEYYNVDCFDPQTENHWSYEELI